MSVEKEREDELITKRARARRQLIYDSTYILVFFFYSKENGMQNSLEKRNIIVDGIA
jgi:hypothetical protein